MKCSCIDIGSNTVKISVFERRGGHWKNIGFRGEQTGLIGYVVPEGNGKILSDDGLKALIDVLIRLCKYSEEMRSDRLFAFATASLRGVDNIDKVTAMVYSSVGITLDVISGEEEALCSLRGLLLDERCEGVSRGIMMDMGGGSTEIVLFENGKPPVITSLPFGCLYLTNKCVEDFPPKLSDIIRVGELVKKSFSECSFAQNAEVPVFLVGGTARAAEKMIRVLKLRLRGEYRPSDFLAVAERMATDEETRELARNLIPKRVHTITAGCSAYYELLKYISPTKVIVSDSGVREGYLERILG